MRSAPFLQLDLQPSRLEQWAVLAVLLLAASAIFWSGLPSWSQCLLVAAALAFTALQWRHRRRCALFRATSQPDGAWLLQSPIDACSGRLIAASAVGQLISLTWDTPQGARRLLIWPDAVSPSSARELRVWLRSGRALMTADQAEQLDLI